jgi:hypothetical protein
MENKNLKPEFIGVNQIHTFQFPKPKEDEDQVIFYGMNVLHQDRGEQEFVLLLSPEQVIEMYDFMIEELINR